MSKTSRQPRTRVPAIRQFQEVACGAAVAQMILYGRDMSKFDPPASDTLKNTVTVKTLRSDQSQIREKIEQNQSQLERGWATHPEALARVLTDGVRLLHQPRLKGVASRVHALRDQDAVLTSVRASLRKKTGAATLINESHWVVIYRDDSRSDSEGAIYYRDPYLGARKGPPTRWESREVFKSRLHRVTSGQYGKKYVLVVAK